MGSSTFENPWFGRLIRIGVTIALLLAFFGLGRYSTYQLMLYNSAVDCECSWLDDFGAGSGEFILGHTIVVLFMSLAALVAFLSLIALLFLVDFVHYLWNGSGSKSDQEETYNPAFDQSDDCHDANCTCGYHCNPSRFDEEDEMWYGYCRDRSCRCVCHHDETFDEELGEWV